METARHEAELAVAAALHTPPVNSHNGYATIPAAGYARASVTDVPMPALHGLEATRRLTVEAPSVGEFRIAARHRHGSVPAAHRPGTRNPRAAGRGLFPDSRSSRPVPSPTAVRNSVSDVFADLQVADRAEAIVRAREAGLGR